MRMRTRIICIIAALAVIVTGLGRAAPAADPAPLAPEAGKAVAGLGLTLGRVAKGVLEVTFENVDKKPMVLNLGNLVGNGRYLEPMRFHLIVTGLDGKSREFHWKGIGGYAGRVDDFLVPLMPGAKYTITFSLDDLIGDRKEGNWSSAVAGGEKVQAAYEGRAEDPRHEVIPALPIWLGKIESASLGYVD